MYTWTKAEKQTTGILEMRQLSNSKNKVCMLRKDVGYLNWNKEQYWENLLLSKTSISHLYSICTSFIAFTNSVGTITRNFTTGNVFIDIFSLKRKQCLIQNIHYIYTKYELDDIKIFLILKISYSLDKCKLFDVRFIQIWAIIL